MWCLCHRDVRELAGPSLERKDGVGPIDAIVEGRADEAGNETDGGRNAGDSAVDEGVVSDLIESVSILQRWNEVWGLTEEALLAIRAMALVMAIIVPQVTRAIVGRRSNSLGQTPERGRRKSVLTCVLSYTDSVSAEVPTMVRPASRATTINARRIDSAMRVTRTLFSNARSRVSNSLVSG